jgi:hypothetical protein
MVGSPSDAPANLYQQVRLSPVGPISWKTGTPPGSMRFHPAVEMEETSGTGLSSRWYENRMRRSPSLCAGRVTAGAPVELYANADAPMYSIAI